MAGMGTPGLLFPLVAVAEKVRALGHEVAFVTDRSFADDLRQRGLDRIPRGIPDGPSFQLAVWANPVACAIQVRHLEAGIAEFRPDVVLSSENCLGALVVAEREKIPSATLGSVAFLWPMKTRNGSDSIADQRRSWRRSEVLKHLNAVRVGFGMRPLDDSSPDEAFLGRRYFLQAVPELLVGQEQRLPRCVRVIGSCLLDGDEVHHDSELVNWVQAMRRENRKALYVQLGRTFNHPSFWPKLLNWAMQRRVALIVCSERYDRALDAPPQNVFIRERIQQNHVLPYVDGVVCGGHATAVLGAITHGLPLAILYTGSGTEEIAEICSNVGLAKSISVEESGDDNKGIFDQLLEDESLRKCALRISNAFQQLDGPTLVTAELLELCFGQSSVTKT